MIQRDLERALGDASQASPGALAEGTEPSLGADKMKKLFDQTERSVDRLSRLVDDMLDISRITTGRLTLQFEKFDLTKMVRELADRMSPMISQSRCCVKIDGDDVICGVWDRLRVEQVFRQFDHHAAKYGAGKPIEIHLRQLGEFVDIRVRDRGRGIAPHDHERIFQRFERAISVHEISGLGLGLYIVRHILTMHGGAIHVRSEIGQGAEFIVHLPLRSI